MSRLPKTPGPIPGTRFYRTYDERGQPVDFGFYEDGDIQFAVVESEPWEKRFVVPASQIHKAISDYELFT